MMTQEIKLTVESFSHEEEWEDFVARSPQGSFYHTLEWKRVLEQAFQLETMYLVVRESEGSLVAVCPFVIWKELKVIKVLDSLKNSDCGGVLVKEGYGKLVVQALVSYLKGIARQKGLAYAKMRLSEEKMADLFEREASEVDTSEGMMVIDLQEKPTDYLWNKGVKTKARQMIRKLYREGYAVREADTIEDLKKFYDLYCRNMDCIGATPYSFDFFEQLFSLPSKSFHVLVMIREDQCIGGIAFFSDRPRSMVCASYLGFDREAQYHHAFQHLAWEVAKWAEENGYRYANLGLTPADSEETHHAMKQRLGAEFSQDYVVYLPFSRSLFTMREKLATTWRAMSPRLPKKLHQKLFATAEAR